MSLNRIGGPANTVPDWRSLRSQDSSETIRPSTVNGQPPAYETAEHPSEDGHEMRSGDAGGRSSSLGGMLHNSLRQSTNGRADARSGAVALNSVDIGRRKPSGHSVGFHMEQVDKIRIGLSFKSALDATSNPEARWAILSHLSSQLALIENRPEGNYHHSKSMAANQLQTAAYFGLEGMGYQKANLRDYQAASRLVSQGWSAGEIMTSLASYDPELLSKINGQQS